MKIRGANTSHLLNSRCESITVSFISAIRKNVMTIFRNIFSRILFSNSPQTSGYTSRNIVHLSPRLQNWLLPTKACNSFPTSLLYLSSKGIPLWFISLPVSWSDFLGRIQSKILKAFEGIWLSLKLSMERPHPFTQESMRMKIVWVKGMTATRSQTFWMNQNYRTTPKRWTTRKRNLWPRHPWSQPHHNGLRMVFLDHLLLLRQRPPPLLLLLEMHSQVWFPSLMSLGRRISLATRSSLCRPPNLLPLSSVPHKIFLEAGASLLCPSRQQFQTHKFQTPFPVLPLPLSLCSQFRSCQPQQAFLVSILPLVFFAFWAKISGVNETSASEISNSSHAEGPRPIQPPKFGLTANREPTSILPTPIGLNIKAPEFTPPKISTPFTSSQPSSSSFPAAPTGGSALHPSGSRPFTATSTHTSFPAASITPPTTSVSNKLGAPTPPSVGSHLNRLTAPQLLRVNTNTSSVSSSPSPGLPPTPKLQQVSLPSTPSAPPNPIVSHLRSGLEQRGSLFSNSSKDILSPLVFGTQKTLQNFTPLSTPQGSQIFQTPPPLSINGKGKAPDRSMYDNLEVIEEMKKRALAFSQKSLLVKESFARWLKRAMDRAAWHEACQRGDEYRQKINNQSRHSSILRSTPRPGTPPEKERQISMNGMDLSPPKKRTRKRISTGYQPPRTDEDLAKRFKEVCIPPPIESPFLNNHHRICKNMSNVGLKGRSSIS